MRLYASYWYDDALGLYFLKTRLYDPEIGRFYSYDEIQDDTDSLLQNPYLYCSNNPINRIDPDGKIWWDKVKSAASSAVSWAKEHKAEIIATGVAIGVGIVTGGIGTGLSAAIIGSAISGAAYSATHYTISNWGHLNARDFAKVTSLGAIEGAIGGAAGYGLGKGLEKVFGRLADKNIPAREGKFAKLRDYFRIERHPFEKHSNDRIGHINIDIRIRINKPKIRILKKFHIIKPSTAKKIKGSYWKFIFTKFKNS